MPQPEITKEIIQASEFYKELIDIRPFKQLKIMDLVRKTDFVLVELCAYATNQG